MESGTPASIGWQCDIGKTAVVVFHRQPTGMQSV